jgi:hypothetical protein|uniref:Uncharacterized protein n=1 Tax=Desulfobacca acetoxidans TaxID=60893 RepID=A0A7C3UZ51_9BACT
MNRDRQIELVRSLTRQVMASLRPEKLTAFAEDFAASIVGGEFIRAEENLACHHPRTQALDTTLVAGMFFQVLREAEKLPVSTPERVSFIRRQAKSYLATRLAGQIPLSQFFRLLNLIEENVQSYFDEARGSWLSLKKTTLSKAQAPEPQAEPREENIRAEALRQALEALPLMSKGRRKLTSDSLEKFLRRSRGNWFRVLDFEAHFRVNKKTAWAYLHQLLQAGIVKHNGEKANRVRYMLADSFHS